VTRAGTLTGVSDLPAEGPDTTPARIRVLIVDDHRMVADSLARALGAQPDMEIVGVEETAAGAERVAKRDRPDVVLMDYRLQDGDGLMATDAVRAAHPAVQVVMVTSMEGEDILVAAVEHGCAGYLLKSSPLPEVLEAVRAVARGESTISPAVLRRVLPRLRRDYQRVGGTLTLREKEVLSHLADGLSNAAIAQRLGLSVNTVRNHVQNVLMKLNAHSKLEAVAIATREGLLERR
jgi:DNA-binding NarL/FixJ family response regulator